MIIARRTSVWRSRYQIVEDGRPVATWDGSVWKSGGDVELAGRRYRVHGNVWGSRYAMADAAGAPVVSAERVGRKHWTVEAAGRAYHFRRSSIWGNEQELYDDEGRIGSIKRVGWWRSEVIADLPDLPLPVQVFVVGVVITMWESEAAVAAT